jgi:acyl-CoA synthetase (NDP forming)
MSEPSSEEHDRDRPPLDPLLRARSLAIVGASATPGAFGHALLRQTLDAGYPGTVYPINPRRAEIDELRCYPSLADLPERVDCAVLAVADERLEAALEATVAASIPAAVIFGGLPVPGERQSLPDRLRRIANEGRIALLGGNAMGFYNYQDRLFVSGYPLQERAPAGTIAVITHSGSSFSALANSGRGLRFSYVISPGQELTLTAADYLHFVLEQPETRVVGLFLEAVRDPERFVAVLELAARREIPVVVLKAGRSERGRAMALAHSGALAGSDDAFRALCRRWCVMQVRSLDEMTDTLELLSDARWPRGRGKGLALAGDSGGERALIVDLATERGVPWAPLGEATMATIGQALDPGLEAANPLDLWGSGHNWEHVYETCLLAMARDPAAGAAVLAVDLVRGSRLTPGYAAVIERVHEAARIPVAVLANLASAVDGEAAAGLRAKGIPVLMGTETGLAALGHALSWKPAEPRCSPAPIDGARAAQWESALAGRTAPLDEVEGKRLLADWGIPVVAERLVETGADAIEAARAVGWPVVMKTAAPGVLHKSDAGGVVLELADEAAARAAYVDLAGRFGPRVVVQQQVPTRDTVELFLGMRLDPQFGPLVSFGLGGVWVEALRDVIVALPPLDVAMAEGLLSELRGASLLLGARGRAPVKMQALCEAIAAFSRMAAALGPALSEIDVNPLLAGPEGVVAVDALVVPRGAINRAENAVL